MHFWFRQSFDTIPGLTAHELAPFCDIDIHEDGASQNQARVASRVRARHAHAKNLEIISGESIAVGANIKCSDISSEQDLMGTNAMLLRTPNTAKFRMQLRVQKGSSGSGSNPALIRISIRADSSASCDSFIDCRFRWNSTALVVRPRARAMSGIERPCLSD